MGNEVPGCLRPAACGLCFVRGLVCFHRERSIEETRLRHLGNLIIPKLKHSQSPNKMPFVSLS